MAYSLQSTDFENISSGTISLKLLAQYHIDELLTATATPEEIIMTLNAGILLGDLLDQASGKNQQGGKTPSHLFLAVVSESQLVGIINVGYTDMLQASKLRPHLNLKSSWYIHSIWIRSKSTGKGIGLKALELICNHAKKLDPVVIRADINTKNLASTRIFEKAGFVKKFVEEAPGGLYHAAYAL